MSKKKYNEIPVVKDVVKEVAEEATTVEKEKLEKIVSVRPTKVKKSLIGRLFNGIMGPDGAVGIGEYVTEEIIKPAIKNIVVDTVTSGVNRLMYGERGGPNHYGRSYPHSGHGSTQRTNYSAQYTSRPTQEHSRRPAERHERSANRYSVDEYPIADRFEASHVLTVLTERADAYGSVSVADYYELIDIPSVYTDNNYGWTYESIVRATLVSVRGGFIIRFPPLEVI